ncbi:MAG: lamin tail domain-containing protein [Bacteroidota bacterium]
MLFLFIFFSTQSVSSQIVINEIMYNIPGMGETEEFLELYNAGTNPVDLQGYSFTQGVMYTFGVTTLAADSYFVLAVDSAAFNLSFGMGADAVFFGTLSNGGEDIVLSDGLGTVIDSVHYESNSPWPLLAAGQGRSLQLCDPLSDNGVGLNWGTNNIATGINTNTGIDSLYATPGQVNSCYCLATSSNEIITSCGSYLSPSGNFLWVSSNIYVDTIPNAANCDSIITVDLTIINTDTIVTQSANTLTSNETGAIYQWLECPGMTQIQGATNQAYTASVNGSYAVAITQNNCVDTSACYALISVGLLENNIENNVVVYPNPSDGNFVIDLGSSNQETTIIISNVYGKIIRSISFDKGQLLDISLQEPNGIYLISIQAKDEKTMIRLIKK